MIATFSEIANHDVMDAAMTPPTPSTADNSSAVASAIASSEPKCDARDSAAAGPRFFIPSAVNNFEWKQQDFAHSVLQNLQASTVVLLSLNTDPQHR